MSILAEQIVIGSLLMEQNSIAKIYGVLESDMFVSELLGRIYKEYQRAFDTGTILTLPVIEQKLRCDGIPSDIILCELKECSQKTITSSEIRQNANVIVSDYKARKLTKMLNSIKVTPSNFKEQIRAISEELEVLQDKKEEKSKTLAEIAAENKNKYFREKEIPPIKLGFPKIDNLLGDLEGGDMIVIGARPGVGKSALVTQITSYLAKQGKRIGFYNLEMKPKQMYERFVVSESGIGLTRLRRATRFLGDEKERFDKANETLEKADNIIITSTGAKTPMEIKAESKHMDYDIIIIDYLQLLQPDKSYGGNRTAEVGNISRGIKNIAMDLNVPVIALSQLNRVSESRDTKEPTMAELREAGNIEQDASVIMLLWNLSENDGTKKGCKIAKQRQGENGKVVLKFNGNLMRFEETDEDIKTAKEWKKVDNNPFD